VEVVSRAIHAGVSLLFLTDHDNVSGFSEALAASRGSNVDVRCGIEINTSYKDQVHILGYGMDVQAPAFQDRLEEFRQRRVTRIKRIIENLSACGIAITFEDVHATGHDTLGRPHIADALCRKGLVRNRKEAFNRFLVKGKPGYVEPMGPSPDEAIQLIRDAGGFASLAHPETLGDFTALSRLVQMGLEGLEVYYNTHGPSDIRRFSEQAEELGLLATGGTDFHGPGTDREGRLGVDVPDVVFDRFMERLSRCY